MKYLKSNLNAIKGKKYIPDNILTSTPKGYYWKYDKLYHPNNLCIAEVQLGRVVVFGEYYDTNSFDHAKSIAEFIVNKLIGNS